MPVQGKGKRRVVVVVSRVVREDEGGLGELGAPMDLVARARRLQRAGPAPPLVGAFPALVVVLVVVDMQVVNVAIVIAIAATYTWRFKTSCFILVLHIYRT